MAHLMFNFKQIFILFSLAFALTACQTPRADKQYTFSNVLEKKERDLLLGRIILHSEKNTVEDCTFQLTDYHDKVASVIHYKLPKSGIIAIPLDGKKQSYKNVLRCQVEGGVPLVFLESPDWNQNTGDQRDLIYIGDIIIDVPPLINTITEITKGAAIQSLTGASRSSVRKVTVSVNDRFTQRINEYHSLTKDNQPYSSVKALVSPFSRD